MLRKTLVLCAVLLAGCGDEGTDTSIPTDMRKLGGDGQIADIGSPLPQPLEVVVTNINEDPIDGVTVNWVIESGGGSLSAGASTTDDLGRARILWTLGQTPGVQQVRAFSGTIEGSPAFFRATANDPGNGGGGPPIP